MFYRGQKKLCVVALFCLAIAVPLQKDFKAEESSDRQSERKTRKVHVVAERFNFTPSNIKVKQGTRLEIELTSDDTFHGFRLPAGEINVVIPPRGRGSVTVVFDAKETGSYAFECSRPCGAGHTMMRGVIVVE